MSRARLRVPVGRQWTHPGIRALLRDAGPDADAYEVIRRRAREIAAEALSANWEGPPYCLETLASFRNHRIVELWTAPSGQEAFRIPGVIHVSTSWPPTRRRYSIAHELVHELVPDGDGEVTEHELPPELADRAHRELEGLCQVGAAELVMPYGPFIEHLRRRPRGVASLIELAGLFEASLEATARRAVDLSHEPTVMVLARPLSVLNDEELDRLAPRAINSGLRDDDLIVTKVCVSRPVTSVRVFAGQAVPRHSAVRRAWGWAAMKPAEAPRVHIRRETWNADGQMVDVQAEAVALPLRRVPIEILAILYCPTDS